jgi:hypothetical protein
MAVLRHCHTERIAGGRVIVLYFPFRQASPLRTSDVFISTVGQLHEAVQSLGPLAWFEFQRAYHEAAGLKPKRKQKLVFAPGPAAEPHNKPDTPSPPLFTTAYPLDEGLRRALLEMPEQVAAFLLHAPQDPPEWRHRESPDEKALRERLESGGCWTG